MATADSAARGTPPLPPPALSVRERARVFEVTPQRAARRNTRAGADRRRHLSEIERRSIDAALAILERLLTERDVFSSSADVRDYLRLQLGDQAREHFGVMCLDSLNKLIAFEIVFSGTPVATTVYPREVATRALMHGAVRVIVAHNHPSGTVQPSAADRSLTNTLKVALSFLDIELLDHVIVSAAGALSMAEAGLL